MNPTMFYTNPIKFNSGGIYACAPEWRWRVGGMVDFDLWLVKSGRGWLATQERVRLLELQIRLDVTTAVSDLESSAERVRATENAIAQARESLRIEREKYDPGKGSITDVLDAQSALLDAQTSYYGALAEHNAAIAQLRLAVGEEP